MNSAGKFPDGWTSPSPATHLPSPLPSPSTHGQECLAENAESERYGSRKFCCLSSTESPNLAMGGPQQLLGLQRPRYAATHSHLPSCLVATADLKPRENPIGISQGECLAGYTPDAPTCPREHEGWKGWVPALLPYDTPSTHENKHDFTWVLALP